VENITNRVDQEEERVSRIEDKEILYPLGKKKKKQA
jgi:hypothetical protein